MIPRDRELSLEQAAQTVIDRICKARIGTMSGAPSIEVDYIASLIVNGATALESAWQALLPGIGVHVGGVYCHGTPKVNIRGTCPRPMRTKTQNCELADLLVLHSHKVRRRTYRRGVLIQTKLDDRVRFTPDEPQFWLYADWPKFSIKSPGFDARDRDFFRDTRSGRYGLVSPRGWYVSEPVSPMSRSNSGVLPFSQFLVRMLYDSDPAQKPRSSIYGRQVYKRSQADWSKTVWDLINVTATRPLVHKHAYSKPPSSRSEGTLALLASEMGDRNIPPGGDGVDADGEREGEGVSILNIVTEAEQRTPA